MPYHLQHCGAKYKSFKHSTDVFFEPRYNCRKVFSDAEETMLKDCFIKTSKIHYGLSAKSARELAYQFEMKVNKSFPSIWENNKSAEKDWLSGRAANSNSNSNSNSKNSAILAELELELEK